MPKDIEKQAQPRLMMKILHRNITVLRLLQEMRPKAQLAVALLRWIL